jgi:L-aspartate oxidase
MNATPIKLRRYLVQFSSHNVPQVFTDVLVIGSGIAGLRAALEASEHGRVVLVTKAEMKDGSTAAAQGGIAVVLGEGDTVEGHVRDTLEAGQQLCDEPVVRMVVEEGRGGVRELMALGVQFDREDGELAFTREGGHGRARILHANGDATGASIEDVLCARVRENADIQVLEDTFAVDLLTAQGRCDGVLAWQPERGQLMVRATQTILATGGCGHVYRETTNPDVATGDGIAMAFRAGAELQDMEFMQFHPTTLYVAGARRHLLSEAMRGEGGVLRNRAGERFMERYHPQAELAPRDIVSRAIIEEVRRTQYPHVFLDVTHIDAERLALRFPTIQQVCAGFGIDIRREMIPVRPAAHYTVGGVKVDADGRTSIPGLLACGEVASTGLHGANRLGSNSLLEGLVFGKRSGRAAGTAVEAMTEPQSLRSIQGIGEAPSYGTLDLADVENSLRALMWRNIGVIRSLPLLDEAEAKITFWCRYVMDKQFESPRGWQVQNLLTTARLITMCARQREESRGTHYRQDFPESRPEWTRHIVVCRPGDGWL